MKEELIINGLSGETPFRVAGRMIFEHRVGNMLLHEDGVRAGDDIEALHDMRVYSRRLREALRIFERACECDRFRPVYCRVRNITRSLGEVRNLDVFIKFFSGYLADVESVESLPAAAEKLIAWAEKRRDKLRRNMMKELDKLEPKKLHHDVMRLIAAPPGMDHAADTMVDGAQMGEAVAVDAGAAVVADGSVASAVTDAVEGEPHGGSARAIKVRHSLAFNARKLIHDRMTAVEEQWKVAEAAKGPREEELHELRISFKKLRYGIETLYPALEMEKLDAIYARVKDYQDVLGDIHDADVFHAVVRQKLEKAEAKGDHLLAAGYFLIAARLESRRHELDKKFRGMSKEYGAPELREAVEGAFRPIPRKEKKRLAADYADGAD